MSLKTFFHTDECALIRGKGPCDCGAYKESEKEVKKMPRLDGLKKDVIQHPTGLATSSEKSKKDDRTFVNGIWIETEEEIKNWESI